MPHYKEIFDSLSGRQVTHTKKRIAVGLLSLRRRPRREIPPRTVEETLLLASWNIREFGRNAMFGHRLDESMQYIAEIINHFDLVARSKGDPLAGRLAMDLGDQAGAAEQSWCNPPAH